MNKDKKLILIENENQAGEYLKRTPEFKDFLPITFNFASEKLLSEKGIKFKTEEEYEKKGLYKGIHDESEEIALKIEKKLKIIYRKINLTHLFYYEIYLIVANLKKYSRLLKEVIKQEKPSEIIVFESEDESKSSEEFIPMILKSIFKKNLKIYKYSLPPKNKGRKEVFIKIISKIQKNIAKKLLNLYSKDKKIILISGGNLYLKSTVKLLSRDKGIKIFNLEDKFIKSFFVRGSYIFQYEIKGESNEKQAEVIRNIEKIKKRLGYLNLKSELGIEKEEKESFKKEFINLIKRELINSSKKIEELYNMMKKEKVDLLLLSDQADYFPKIIIELAKQLNIPTIVFQHGICSDPFLYTPIESDYLLAYGEQIKNSLIKKNKKDAKKIEIIGCPRYDSFIGDKKKKEYKKIIYFMEVAKEKQTIPNTHLTKKRQKDILRRIFTTLKKFPEYQLIVKTRPQWGMRGLPEKIAKEEGFTNFKVIEKANNSKLINNSDLIIVNHSTAGLEAMLLNKKIVSFSYKDFNSKNPYFNIKGVRVLFPEDNFEEALRNIISKENREVANGPILSSIIIADGHASERAVRFINRLLELRSSKKISKNK